MPFRVASRGRYERHRDRGCIKNATHRDLDNRDHLDRNGNANCGA